MADGSAGQGNSIDTISIRITASATGAARSIDQLTASLTNLRATVSSSLSGLTSLSSQLSGLSAGLTNLRASASGMNTLQSTLRNISSINLTNTVTGLRELSNITFNNNDIQDALNNMRALTEQMNALSTAMGNIPNLNLRNLNNVGTQLQQGATHAGRFSSALGGVRNIITAIASSKLVNGLKQMVSATNDYIEAMNLASVSLGSFSDEAERFGETVSSALGIDQGTLLENMGLFQNLATSFGVSSDNAYILSKNMSQLAYDFASFHNLDIEDSFLKFQSALAGELEPIRRVGVDISNARLQQELYDLGLQQNISTLNRADKAILTYIAIMKQSTNEMGDMARTIQSPANMLRVLGNQATITGRQIGALFIPALQEILPWAIAVMKVIGQLASTLASLVGFNMEDYLASVDGNAFEGMAGDIEDVGTAAGKAAKQMNNLIGGFDELNVLKKASDSAGSGVIGGNLLDDIDLSKYQYDMLEGLVPTDDLVNQVKDAIKRMMEPFSDISFRNVIRRFADFSEAIKEQISRLDFSEAFGGIWDSLVSAFGAGLDLVSSVILPGVEALNIPKITIASWGTLKSAIDVVKDAFIVLKEFIDPIIEDFSKPVVEWIGKKATDAFRFLSEELKKVSDWLGEHKNTFAEIGTKIGELAGDFWELTEPLADQVWEDFKDIVSEITTDLGELASGVLEYIDSVVSGAQETWNLCKEVGLLQSAFKYLDNKLSGTALILNGFWEILKGIIQFIKSTFTRDWTDAWSGFQSVAEGAGLAIEGKLTQTFGSEGLGATILGFYEDYVEPAFDVDEWYNLGSNAVSSLLKSLTGKEWSFKNFWDRIIPDEVSTTFTYDTVAFNGRSYSPGGIPQLASGNVATDPTLALFGEYPGAHQDPEITAPQSEIYETVVAANGEMVSAVYQMATMIVQAIEDNATEVSADSEGIFKAVRKGAAEYKKSHGVPAF